MRESKEDLLLPPATSRTWTVRPAIAMKATRQPVVRAALAKRRMRLCSLVRYDQLKGRERTL